MKGIREKFALKETILKKITSIFLAVIMLLLPMMLLSCKTGGEGEETQTVYYTVTFNSNGGSEIPSQKSAAGAKVKIPAEPTYDNYVFDEWTYNGKAWDFNNDTVKGDMTLTAQWISADSLFKYSPVENTENACITGFKDGYSPLPQNIVLPKIINGLNVVAVGEGAFKDLSSEDISSIVLHENIVSVGKQAFENCKDITITVKGALTSVGMCAFGSCNKLTSIVLGEGLEIVSPEAFIESGLTKITLPKTLRYIDEDAFKSCSSLGVIVMHPVESGTDTVIGNGAFRECTSLKTVFFYGEKAEIDSILARVSSGNDSFKNAKTSFYSEEKPTESGSFWHMVDGTPREW